MIAAESVAPKKLRIKFSSQIIEAVSARKATNSTCSVSENSCDAQNVKHCSAMQVSNKRCLSGMEDLRPLKKQKMDRSVIRQCSSLIKSLIDHPSGWPFKDPVDPVALNIPDYFTVISNPMDLGTIRSKLEKNLYSGTDELAADVRLTFSNAMLYNPPANGVHKMAVTLKRVFETKWKSLEEKWSREASKFHGGNFSSAQLKESSDTSQNYLETQTLKNVVLPKKPKPSEDKAVRSSNVKAAEVKLFKPIQSCIDKAVEHNFRKDSGGRQACGPANTNPSLSTAAPKCGKCHKSACQCNLHSDSANANSDITSERSTERDHTCSTDTSKLAPQRENMSASHMSKSDPDSDGSVSCLDDENMCPSSLLTIPATDATLGEEWKPPILEVPLSPTKALRAAMLKHRFADTILKAQHKTLMEHGDKADPVKLQLEKEKLEKRQREEKAWIEAQIREAETASRKREEVELKKQREREREAARIALQKMEKTADIVQNLEIVKELEKISGCTLSYSFSFGRRGAEMAKREIEGAQISSPLERLGLYIKDDDVDDEDDAPNMDEEEGEIL